MKKIKGLDSLVKENGLILIPLLVVLVVILIGGFLLYKSFNSSIFNINTEKQSKTNQSSTPVLPSVKVTIGKSGFNPQTVTVKKGQSVEWFNDENVDHQIASDPHPTHTKLPELGGGSVLKNGESMTFTFDKVGTFTYHDHLKPLEYMGTVIVIE